jgi:L-lactate dehydrogenase (cytochrome)
MLATMNTAHSDHLPLYADFRRAAQRRLPRLIFDFMDGGAGQEAGLQRNEGAYRQIELMPRVLRDTSTVDLHCQLPDGAQFDLPLGCAPMGLCNLARPGTDEALARAAAQWNFPVCVSTASSTPLERMAELSQGKAWFQLYVTGSAERASQLARRAWDAGYRSLILTVDVPRLGRRPRDLRNGFKTPLRWQARHVLDFALHPAWSLQTLWAGVPQMANFSGDSKGGYDRNATRSGADWDFLSRLRDEWKGRLVVKGVMDPQDAQKLLGLGVDVIWVSNHGGRQLDSAPASLQALKAIRSLLGPGACLIVDGGVRSGEDILKARALGADMVMMGRPFLYASAAAGAAGVAQFLSGLREDMTVAMAQLGLSKLSQAGVSILAPSRP